MSSILWRVGNYPIIKNRYKLTLAYKNKLEKKKCQCPECHCMDEFEEPPSVEVIPSNPSPSRIDSLEYIHYLESKTHIELCPRCASGQHNVF